MIYHKLAPFIELAGGLSERQYRFQHLPSTINKTAIVIDLAWEAIDVGKCCMVVRLEVNSAFISAKWGLNKSALIRLSTPRYLARLFEKVSKVRDD